MTVSIASADFSTDPSVPPAVAADAPHWGARATGGGGWRFGLWAPDVSEALLVLDGLAIPAIPASQDGWPKGWWQVEVEAMPGAPYLWRLDGRDRPDPAARVQSGDVHGPSCVTDLATRHPADRDGQEHGWAGIAWPNATIYELHIGTFTAAGTLLAATRELPRLKALGITLIELMPLAQFDGERGWGYDGVLPWCLHNSYGTPEDLLGFVATAHALGMGVLLDVVHNHLGPSGNYLAEWCPSFFHTGRRSTWGEGIAWEEPAVREYFLGSAMAWLEDYQLDGLRLDAVHAIDDRSEVHFLDELGARIKARDWGHPIHLVTEDERNKARYFLPDAPFDGTWNDDWHHAIHCLLTGEAESYYAPFAVDPLADIETALRDGYIEQGQPRTASPSTQPRGEPSAHLPRTAFVNFLGNHDQIGNRAKGERLHHLVDDLHALRVVTALTLLAPFTPMLFMGDEFLTDAPFQFFCDFSGDLAEAVRKGRTEEFAQFTSFGGEVPDPLAPATFEVSKIGFPHSDAQHAHEAFVTRLLALRAAHVAPLLHGNARPACEVDREGTVIDALWDFAPGRLSLRARLGEASAEDAFSPHEHALLVLESPDSPFALSFTAISRPLAE